MNRRIVVLLWILLLCSTAGVAQQTSAPIESLPGVAEVVPRMARLAEEEAQARSMIASLGSYETFAKGLNTARSRQEELNLRIARLGDISTWNSDRLLEIRSRLLEQQESLQDLLNEISGRLAQLEALRSDWQKRKEFWERWSTALREAGVELPSDSFRRARRIIEEVLDRTVQAFPPFMELQREITALQEKNYSLLNGIEGALTALKGETFKKTAPAFSRSEYLQQFNEGLVPEVRQGIAAVQEIDRSFLLESIWIAAFQVLVVLLVAGFILRQRRRAAEVTREWLFILRHPWATAIFVAVASLSPFYSVPPALWRFALWILAVFSAAVLISGLLKNPRKIFMVNLLGFLFVFSLFLQITSLPEPLYRLYLSLLALVGAPLLLFIAARNQRAKGGKIDGFTLSLRAGAVVLGLSFVTQAAGYSLLASRLIESSVETVFLGLLAAVAVRLGRGGIEFVLEREFFRQWEFFNSFGRELSERLKRVFQIFVFGYVALYLLVVWRFFGSIGEAWNTLLDSGFQMGELRISIQMVLMIILVLYLTIVLSWILRAILESEFFPRRDIDRGVRDAIKKLLHYSLVLIGFLLAMSLAGVELQNFAVLAGALGIGIGFGLQNIVNNFVSGLILLFERPVKVGDMIVLDDEWGTVRKMGLRSTVVETFDQAEIIVPNSDLVSEKVTNWTLTTRVARVVVNVGVAYGSDVPKVLRILMEAAKEHADILSEPAPSALFTEFGDSSLNFELRAWIADVNRRLLVKSELGQYIDERFRKEGVEIPFPQRDLHLRSIDGQVLDRVGNPKRDEVQDQT